MIRNEQEYRGAVQRLADERARIATQKEELRTMGLTKEQIKRVTDPLQSFHLQLAEEVNSYEKLMRGEINEISNLRNLGHVLISARIARGLTQRELAQRLGTNESQVSRDERNEYHGITLERAARVLDALGVAVRIGVEFTEPLAA